MRLRQLCAELGDGVTLRWRAFPLRPTLDPSATFAGTYREEAWRRCRDLARDTPVAYRMWERPDYPQWSLPALEAANCVALQGEALFEATHLRLYRAFFEEGVNIGRPEEVVPVVREVPGLDVERFLTEGSKVKIQSKLEQVFSRLDKIMSRDDYEACHRSFCDWFTREIWSAEKNLRNGKIQRSQAASYGQAAKVLDIAAKVYVYYCSQPTADIAGRITPLLHGAVDQGFDRRANCPSFVAVDRLLRRGGRRHRGGGEDDRRACREGCVPCAHEEAILRM